MKGGEEVKEGERVKGWEKLTTIGVSEIQFYLNLRTWGPCTAIVVSFPHCPSSLSPQVNTFPSSVHTIQCSEPHAMSTTFLLARAPITRFGER